MSRANLQRREALDPAVAAMLGDTQRRERLSHLPPAQRKKAKRDAERARFTYDLDPALIAAIQTAAHREGISASGLAHFLLTQAMRQYQSGGIDLHPYKRPSRSPKFDWVLEFDAYSATDSSKQAAEAVSGAT